MKVLYIINPKLVSLNGHGYNYARMLAAAAEKHFDQVHICAGEKFQTTDPRIRPCLPAPAGSRLRRLNRPFQFLKTWLAKPGRLSREQTREIRQPLRWKPRRLRHWLKVWRRARRQVETWRRLFAAPSAEGREIQALIDSADCVDAVTLGLFAAGRQKNGPGPRFRLVLRNPPEYECSRFETVAEWGERLSGLAAGSRPRVNLYTDTEALSAAYAAILRPGIEVRTLPIPVSLPGERPPSGDGEGDGSLRVGVMGGLRREKGAFLLPEILRRLPGRAGGRPVTVLVQSRPRPDDPGLRAILREVGETSRGNPGGPQCLILSGPHDEAAYASLYAGLDISLLLYTSGRYRVSSSGIMAEAIHFHVPVITFADTWMGGIVEAARRRGLRIGAALTRMEELEPAFRDLAENLADRRRDLASFAGEWREFHNPDSYMAALLEGETGDPGSRSADSGGAA